MDTPCINVCKLDSQGTCVGCFRTADEIALWRQMTEHERLAIMKDLDKRPTKLNNRCEVQAHE